MRDFLTLIGILFAVAGAGLLIILLLSLINNQLPINAFGAFIGVAPFALLIMAAVILTRRKT